MNMNLLRPVGVRKEDLELWLSSVIHDACRDAQEAGMPEREIHELLKTITSMHHPLGSMGAAADRRRDPK
jgi:hypothetical protein